MSMNFSWPDSRFMRAQSSWTVPCSSSAPLLNKLKVSLLMLEPIKNELKLLESCAEPKKLMSYLGSSTGLDACVFFIESLICYLFEFISFLKWLWSLNSLCHFLSFSFNRIYSNDSDVNKIRVEPNYGNNSSSGLIGSWNSEPQTQWKIIVNPLLNTFE